METGQLTDKKVELDEYTKTDLNEKLSKIQDRMEEQPEVFITYFQQDKKKSGGAYITAAGYVKKIDTYERALVMQDGSKIPIEDIVEIDGELFGTSGHKE
jgi:hypothetical protein